jgi:predicted site-specific integrase-resolvase
MNLREWALLQGIHPHTTYKWFREGTLPVPARKMGKLILVEVPPAVAAPELTTAIYARVSSADQNEDLERQVGRVATWAAANGLPVGKVVTEVGSALDGKRKKFLGLLRDPSAGTIVVEHRDRFAGFGSEYVEAALAAHGRHLAVVDTAETDGDLVRDMTELLTSMCARLYGSSAAADRAARLAALVSEPPGGADG